MCMVFCLSVHLCTLFVPGACGVLGGCEALCGCWELNAGSPHSSSSSEALSPPSSPKREHSPRAASVFTLHHLARFSLETTEGFCLYLKRYDSGPSGQALASTGMRGYGSSVSCGLFCFFGTGCTQRRKRNFGVSRREETVKDSWGWSGDG